MIPYHPQPSLELFGLTLHSFGALVAIGFIVGSHLAQKRAIAMGLDPKPIHDATMICLFGGIGGAHLFDVLFYRPHVILEDPLEILRFWSGLSSYGGFFVATLLLFLYFRKKNLPFLSYAEALLFGLVPGWFFGRMGCFSAHDHPGKLTDFFMAVKFPGGARHDLGLYEALLTGLITIVMYLWARRKPKTGVILGATMGLYGIARFFLDTLRATDLSHSDKRYFDLTPAQYFSMALLFGGVALIIWVTKRSSRPEA